MEKEKKLARERAAVILQVRSGKLTATEGAERLGGVAQDVLRVGGPGPESHGPGLGESVSRETSGSSWMRRRRSLQGKVQDLEKKLYLGGEDDRGEGSAYGLRSSRG